MEIQPHFQDIEKVIINEIDNAEHSVKLAVAWFTSRNILEKVLSKISSENCQVEVIIYDDKINIATKTELQNLGAKVYNVSSQLMHNKFTIIDDFTVITGSFNYTFSASNHKENIVVIRNSKIAESFKEEFEKIKLIDWEYHPIISLYIKYSAFFVSLISTYYDFNKDELNKWGDYLKTGEYYTVCVDVRNFHGFNAGLIFNKNFSKENLPFNPRKFSELYPISVEEILDKILNEEYMVIVESGRDYEDLSSFDPDEIFKNIKKIRLKEFYPLFEGQKSPEELDFLIESITGEQILQTPDLWRKHFGKHTDEKVVELVFDFLSKNGKIKKLRNGWEENSDNFPM